MNRCCDLIGEFNEMAEHQRMAGAIAHHLSARRIWPSLGRGNRTLDALIGRSGFRDRFLVYAGRAPLLNGTHTRIAAPAAVQLLLRTS